jgi:GntR family transcriptional regulator, rspAB operon transcriptional repressor
MIAPGPSTEHRQLRDFVVERIREQIAQGKLSPGEWLRQERLAAELGTSYTPIREALKQLEAEGLVEHVPYRGVRVVAFSADDVEDIYTMRAALEGLAAAGAAERLTAEQLAALRSMHEQMVTHTGSEHLQLNRELNRQFHQAIIEASGRTYLIRILRMIWTWSPTMLWSQFVEPAVEADATDQADDNREHGLILAALEGRDAQAAERLMRRHIDRAWRALAAHLKPSIKE